MTLAAALGCARAAEAPEPHALIFHYLLDLDQEDLFPAGAYSSLAELEAWTDLYGSAHDKAASDGTADRRHLKTFLLIGWAARAKNDFGTIEAFTADFRKLFDAKPDAVLEVMAGQDFMLPGLCAYLAGSFFFEDADPAGREPFIDRHRVSMEKALGPERHARCLESFRQVEP